jgi:hypothetical protein
MYIFLKCAESNNNNIKAFFPSKLGRLDIKPNENIRKKCLLVTSATMLTALQAGRTVRVWQAERASIPRTALFPWPWAADNKTWLGQTAMKSPL